MALITAAVINHDSPGVTPEHPRLVQQAKLVEAWRRLPASHQLVYCSGCEWFVRTPLRLGNAVALARQHLLVAHFTALLEHRAVLDPDLADGFEGFLAERLAQVVPC